MGYDMYWVTTDPAEADAEAVAQAAFDAAVTERNALPREDERYQAAQGKVDATYDALFAARAPYFRLNIFGMGKYREAMYRLGMAFDAGDHPEFPKAEDYGLTFDQVDQFRSPEYYQDDPPLSEEQKTRAAEVEAKTNEVLAWHGPEIPGIPLHKFGSNDGWHVTPPECEAAVRIYRQAVDDQGSASVRALVEDCGAGWDYWQQWITYLTGAIAHGGFNVS